ncbi:MAG: response regulator transcription factor [Alphaproteobacteria bacterium GM202ARS2]|nr:response regulator transcription factor [Alphaproteobacteria bacterium GM202ARS2]
MIERLTVVGDKRHLASYPLFVESLEHLGVPVSKADLSFDIGGEDANGLSGSHGIVVLAGTDSDKESLSSLFRRWRSEGLASFCVVLVPGDRGVWDADLVNAGADKVLFGSVNGQDVMSAFQLLENRWSSWRVTRSAGGAATGTSKSRGGSADSKPSEESVLVFEDLFLHLDRLIVRVGDRRARMTSKEHELLQLLMRHPERVFTKEEIHRHLYPNRKKPDIRIIDVYICKLRRKLMDLSGGSDYIQTEWGRGYVLSKVIVEGPARNGRAS